MRRFLKIVSLMLLMLLAFNVVLDSITTRWLNRSKGDLYRELNAILHDTLDADVLVLGSSRAWVQYNPRIIDSMLSVNSYNLGLDGGSVNRQIVKYKAYRHYQGKKPELVIINFDYWKNWELIQHQRERYFPYFTNAYLRGYLKRQEPFSFMEMYVPMYRYYNQGMLSVIAWATGKNDEYVGHWYKGYRGNTSDWDGTKYASVKSVMFTPNPELVEAFDAFMTELQQDSVRVIFVSSPIYKGVTDITVNLSEFYDFRQSFSERYHVQVLDYLDDSICYDTSNFYNATHMNETGALRFTTKLCRDLDSLAKGWR